MEIAWTLREESPVRLPVSGWVLAAYVRPSPMLAALGNAALGYPSYLGCNRPIQVGHTIMARAARSSSQAVAFEGRSCGGTVRAGETLVATVPGQSQYVLELSGATFSTASMCGATRTVNRAGTLTAPSSGTVSIKAAHSGMQVYVTGSCTLTVLADTSEPSPPPPSPSPPRHVPSRRDPK